MVEPFGIRAQIISAVDLHVELGHMSQKSSAGRQQLGHLSNDASEVHFGGHSANFDVQRTDAIGRRLRFQQRNQDG